MKQHIFSCCRENAFSNSQSLCSSNWLRSAHSSSASEREPENEEQQGLVSTSSEGHWMGAWPRGPETDGVPCPCPRP